MDKYSKEKFLHCKGYVEQFNPKKTMKLKLFKSFFFLKLSRLLLSNNYFVLYFMAIQFSRKGTKALSSITI